MAKARRVAVVTGSRAEYGLLFWILKGIQESRGLKLQLIVTGAHLSSDFGLTAKRIEADGLPIAAKIKVPLSSDTDCAIAGSMGAGVIGFAKAYEKLKPDILVVLGDRFEILSAVVAALPFRIPVAHIHGGESTEGAIDESIRHAITKMSHIHFVSTEKYRKRIIQMGEPPGTVFCFGAPGLDNILRLRLADRDEIGKRLGLPADKKIGVVTYHPVTLEKNTARRQIAELLRSVGRFKDIYWVFTFPNADTDCRIIIENIRNFTDRFPERGKVFTSLGQTNYLSLLKNALLMLGNSSSGLIEAPSFKLPVVNVGDRQRGRIRAGNIIDVTRCEEKAISRAIRRAISPKFKSSLKGLRNPYGSGNSSGKIIEKLKAVSLGERLIKKRFYEPKETAR